MVAPVAPYSKPRLRPTKIVYTARSAVLRWPMPQTLYGMSGAEIAHAAFSLRACYAMSGTAIAYDSLRSAVLSSDMAEAGGREGGRESHGGGTTAVQSTLWPYAPPTRCPVLE
eukprot:107613-Rhodomonas_salina.2